MFYKLIDENGDYKDKTTGNIKNLLEANVVYTPEGTNTNWLEFSTKAEALTYFNLEDYETPTTPGDYLVAKQSDWVALASKMGLTLKTLQDRSKKSINQVDSEYLYMVEFWDLSFSHMLWAWGSGFVLLKEYQANQLGNGVLLIKDENGERLLDNTGNVVSGKEDEVITWCRIFAPEMPFGITQQQELDYIENNNIKNKIKILFDAFKA